MNAKSRIAAGILGLAALCGCAATSVGPGQQPAASIHQEVVYKAPPQRVYDALTDRASFAKLTGRAVAELSREPGGSFTLFDGIILGRQIELVPGKRIVEAWRERTWPEGEYSLVKFELVPEGAGTRVVMDHTGYPLDAGDHLPIGWGENYWEPLRVFLGE
jgi:activator of HSP90 ATPase